MRLTAMEILSRIGPDAQEAVPILFKLLDSEYDRSMAYRTLREIGPRSIPILTDSLDHQSQFVRSLACEYLGRLGPEAREAVPQLTRLAEREREPRVRRAASEALKKIRRGRQRS